MKSSTFDSYFQAVPSSDSTSDYKPAIPLLRTYWQKCESIEDYQPVKLILPDITYPPSYLQKTVGRKLTDEEQSLRDQKRVEAYCLSNNKKKAKKNKNERKKEIQMLLPTPINLKGRELKIEESLLSQYREDRSKLAELDEKIQMYQKKKNNEKRERLKKLMLLNFSSQSGVSELNDFDLPGGHSLATLSVMSARSTTDSSTIISKMNLFRSSLTPRVRSDDLSSRLSQASIRRESLLSQEQQQLQALSDRIQRKLSNIRTYVDDFAQEKEEQVVYRMQTWETIIKLLAKLNAINNIVMNNRKMKTELQRRWRAVTMIQRLVREKLLYRSSSRSAKSTRMAIAIELLKKRYKRRGGNQDLYQVRVRSSSIIIAFLKGVKKGFKSAMISYYGKMRFLQRRFSIHYQVNGARVEALSRLLERCYPSLCVHINIILLDRGMDLGNITMYDRKKIDDLQMNSSMRRRHFPHLISHFNSVDFHAILRENIQRIQSVQKYFAPNAKFSLPNHEKRIILMKFITSKRREFVTRIQNKKEIKLNPVRLDADMVKCFIRGGQDPVSDHILRYEELILKIHEDRKKQLLNKKRVVVRLREVALYLYHGMSTADVLILFLDLAEQDRIWQRLQRMKSRGGGLGGLGGGRKSNPATPSHPLQHLMIGEEGEFEDDDEDEEEDEEDHDHFFNRSIVQEPKHASVHAHILQNIRSRTLSEGNGGNVLANTALLPTGSFLGARRQHSLSRHTPASAVPQEEGGMMVHRKASTTEPSVQSSASFPTSMMSKEVIAAMIASNQSPIESMSSRNQPRRSTRPRTPPRSKDSIPTAHPPTTVRPTGRKSRPN